MTCDDVVLLLAVGEGPTLSGVEETHLQAHLAECATCRELAAETADAEAHRWIARVPQDAFDDRDLLVLPVVDPIVFCDVRELASGGMGRIARAHDRRLGRDVAIKEVLGPELRARFEREALITARLQHPAIVPVYEAGTWPDGSAFYAMRLVSGGTLAEAIGRTKTLEERLALLPHVRAVTEALAYAHSRRIIHRDLKPGNVLVGEFGETVVIDWGLAKELDRDVEPALDAVAGDTAAAHGLTIAGSVMGTPGFMAPEQAVGGLLDARADVYALGAILYNVLAGEAPYWDRDERSTPTAVLAAVRVQAPTPIRQLAPRAPADLLAIVERAMARAPEARYATAGEMAEELRRFETGQLIGARDYRLRDLLWRWIRRHRGAVIVGGVALVVLAIVGVLALLGIEQSREAERAARQVAERARGVADTNVAALLEEQGRSELLAGDDERALAYLAEAYRGGRDTVALRHLLAVATRDQGLLERTLGRPDKPRRPMSSVGFASGGRVVTVDSWDTSRIAIWDGATLVASHPIGFRVFDARVDPAGRRVVAMNDTTIAMFDVESGAELWRAADSTLVDATVEFSPDGTLLVAVGERERGPHEADVRDADTGVLRRLVTRGVTVAAAFSADDGLLATCSADGQIGVWNPRTGGAVAAIHVDREPSAIAFLAADRVIVGTTQPDVIISKFATNELQSQLTGHYDQVTAIGVSADQAMIATGDLTGALRLWTAEGMLLGETRDYHGELDHLAFSPDGALLVGVGGDKRVYLWDTPSLGLRRAVDAFGKNGGVGDFRAARYPFAWSADGTRFATLGYRSPDARVWKTPAGNRVARWPSDSVAIGAEVAVSIYTSAPGNVLGRDGSEVSVHGLADGGQRAAFGKLRAPAAPWTGADASRDGRRVLLWTDGAAATLDTATGAVAPLALEVATAAQPPRLSADGRFVLELAGARVRVTELASGTRVLDLARPGIVDGELSPDGTWLALAGAPPALIRVATGEEVALPAIKGKPTHVRFDRTGGRVIVLGVAPPRVLATQTGAVIATLAQVGAKTKPQDAAFATGDRVATWNDDRSAQLWDLKTGALLVTVDAVSEHAIAVTRDGARLATGAADGSIRIWDGATGRLLEVLHGHRQLVTTLGFSDDGTRLVAGSVDGTATIWDVHLELRSVAEISDLAARASPWRLVDGLLAPM